MMDITTYLFRSIIMILTCLISLTGYVVTGQSQPVSIEAELNNSELIAGEEAELTFSITDDTDAYFFSIEVGFDRERLEFLGAEATGILDNGLVVADLLSPATAGISVTRTTPMAGPQSGQMVSLFFRVRTFTPTGEDSFSFSMAQLADSGGSPIPFESPEDREYEILESISEVSLTAPLQIDVTEGDTYEATGQVYSPGISTDESESGRITTWMGVSDTDSNPLNWAESTWKEMDFKGQTQDDFFEYSGEIALQKPVGTYYVALRSDIDHSGEFLYGGVGGIWDSQDHPSAMLEIMQQPPFRYTIAEWTFADEVYTPARAIPVNQNAELEIYGASINGFTSGAANSNSWSNFEEGKNYWQIVVSTENLEDLRLSSKQYSSGTGPGDFQLQSSLDGENWSSIGGPIEVASNYTSGVLDQIPLPANLYDQPNVYLRWLQTDSLRVDQDESGNVPISAGGTSRIDDILVTGINPNADRVEVWPGDTNTDGEVNEEDVLVIGNNWLAEGPPAIFPSIHFDPRMSEEWVPAGATYADASGDGRVDHNDLQPIGLHFGKTVQAGKRQVRSLHPIASLQLEPIQAGETADVFLIADEPIELSGISFRLDVDGLDHDHWSVSRVESLEWAGSWAEKDRLIQFSADQPDLYAASIVHKGAVDPAESQNLVRIRLRAERDWNQPVAVRLMRASITARGEIEKPTGLFLAKEISVAAEPDVDEIPQRTQLLPNYPNPFNPVTTIPYTLSESGDVEVDVFDAIGRRVAVFQREAQQPGEYAFQFDASSLSSGLYLYRLRTNGVVHIRKMTLLK